MDPEENKSAEADKDTSVLYRHKTIRRYRIGEWEFENNHLRIRDAAENERFLELLRKMPRSETLDIVVVDEVANSIAERPVIRGVADSTSATLTANDRKRFEEELAKKNASAAGAAAGAKPAVGAVGTTQHKPT